MQCSTCGAELEDGFLFCRDCGAKVEKVIKFCSECGVSLNPGVKYCPSCGAKVESPIVIATPEGVVEDDSTPEVVLTQYPQREKTGELNADYDCAKITKCLTAPDYGDIKPLAYLHKLSGRGIQEQISNTAANLWDSFDLYAKTSAIICVIVVQFFLFALIGHNSTAKALAVLQLLLVIFALLIHKRMIIADKQWLKFVILGLSAIILIPSITSFKQKTNSNAISQEISTVKDTMAETTVTPVPEITFYYEDNPEKQGPGVEVAGTTEPIIEPVIDVTVPAEVKTYDLDKDLIVTKCRRDADKTTMYYIRFSEKDSSGNYVRDYEFDSCINPRTMGKNFNAIGDLPSWFYVGATVHVKANFGYNGLKDCNVTEASSSTLTPNVTSSPEDSVIEMPIMHGLTVDLIMDAAKQYGISVQPFSDEDFGGGTKHRELTNSSNGLNLEFTYDSSTKEVLCASIVTFAKLSSAQEQKDVVIGMSKIICPPEDSSTVSSWVNSNIGKKAETTINNFIYELWLGSSGNICYNAGVQNWEKWELHRE